MASFSVPQMPLGTLKRERADSTNDSNPLDFLEQHDLTSKRPRLDSRLTTRLRSSTVSSDTFPGFLDSDEPHTVVALPFDRPGTAAHVTSRPPPSTASTVSSALPYKEDDFVIRRGKALMRSCSMQSLVEAPKVFYEQPSAFHNLKYTRTSIDYTHNSAVNFSAEVTGIPFTASSQNLLLFGRGNRVHYKNLQTSEGIGQLCNLKRGKHSDLYMLSCPASADVNNTVAVSTGHDVHLWDFAAKKEISSWQSKQHTFLAWNGPTLTVGTRTGTIRSYDTRIASKAGVRDRLTKSIRHESTISALAWSDNGRFLASGDVGGTVYVWDIRDGFKTPLEVGDQVQRRKKIQHDASITSIAWCDYSPKIFSTADSKGSLRVWNADVTIPGPTSSIVSPGRLDVGAPIRNVFFSPHIKELLVVKGPAPRLVNQPEAVESNCLTSYAYPSLRHVVTSSHVSEGQDVGNAILLKGGTKAVVSVPTQGKLHIWDVFAKPKSLKRQSSFAGLR